jgi:hypothetical protein
MSNEQIAMSKGKIGVCGRRLRLGSYFALCSLLTVLCFALCSLLIELGVMEMGLIGWLRGLGHRAPGEEILVEDEVFRALFEEDGTPEDSAYTPCPTPQGGGGGGGGEE